ncbi:MAG TPA: trypsin-like peptidase domain-containing protein [Tepidiformaceae bacterium]|nr:trypsin-like peptidase domain-containing protein [Tepidiformaceae bacterium]
MHRLLRPAVAGLAALALLVGAACSSNSGGGSSATSTDNGSSTTTSATATPHTTSQPKQSADQMTTEELVKFAEPSVVRIETDNGVGSGFVIDADGYIMTNNHVVQGARTITVTLSDGSEKDAQVVGTDPKGDLALVKVDASGLKALKLADLNQVQIGQDVVAIGYALDLSMGEGPSFSVTRGIVSQKNRAIDESSGILGAVQTDAAINHGNSGGPLLDLFGEVVGINTALQPDQATGGVAQGIGYAVGSDTVKAVYDQLRANGRVNRGLLGVRGFDSLRPAQAKALGLPEDTHGVYLPTDPVDTGRGQAPSVDPNGPAARGGIQTGDVITKIADVEVDNEGDLAVAMIKHGPNEKVKVELYRDGKKTSVDVTLGTP